MNLQGSNKKLLQAKFDNDKRHFRLLVKKRNKVRITEFELNSKKYTSLLRNWSHTSKSEEVIKNEDCINKGLKRRSNSFVDKDLESLNELLIVPFEWQIPIIMYDCHTKQGSHLKIDPTWEKIKASGFKWNSIGIPCILMSELFGINEKYVRLVLLLVETIPLSPRRGILFTNSQLVKTIPSPLQKNKVNHINKIIITKLSLMHPCLFSKKYQFVLRIWFSWSITINLQRLA